MLCNYRMSGYGYEYQEGSRPDSSAIHLASSSHIWSLLAENHTLTKSKSRSFDQKLNQVKLESVRTLLKSLL